MSLLSGCSRVHSEYISPDVIEYSKEKQKALARELNENSCPISEEFLLDYLLMRDQARIKK